MMHHGSRVDPFTVGGWGLALGTMLFEFHTLGLPRIVGRPPVRTS